jgi:hypothetical protein
MNVKKDIHRDRFGDYCLEDWASTSYMEEFDTTFESDMIWSLMS